MAETISVPISIGDDKPEAVAIITGIYREAIDCLRAGQAIDVAEGLSKISAATGRPLSDGPFDFQSIQVADKEKELVRT